MRGACLVIGGAVLGISALFFSFVEGWNGQSRWALSLALARRGTTAVDEFIGESRDVCASGGHLYAAKAPGIGLLGAPIVWLADRFVSSTTPKADAAKRLLVRSALVSSCGALIAVLLCRAKTPLAPLASVACCLGSPVLPYATVLYGHVTAGACLLAAWRLADRGRPFTAGLLLGASIAVDYLAAPAAVVLLVLTGCPDPRGALRMLVGMLPAAILLGTYNLVSFGTVLASGYEGLVEEEFMRAMARGVRGIGMPSFRILSAMLWGRYRGLMLLSPWLVLWLVAAFRRVPWRQWVMTVAVPWAYLVMLSGFTVWWGGASLTVRHAILVVPLMAWGVSALAAGWAPVLLVLGVVSFLAHLGFTVTDPEVPENVAFPLRDFVLPRLRRGCLRSSLLGAHGPGPWVALGLAIAVGGLAWGVAWRATRCCDERSRVASFSRAIRDWLQPRRDA